MSKDTKSLKAGSKMAVLRWLKAVGGQWWFTATGGVLVLGLTLLSELKGITVSPRIYEIIVILAFFPATFFAWREQETKRLDAETHIRELEMEKPDFVSSLAILLAADNTQTTNVFADLAVINQGEKASVIKNLRFSYTGPTGQKHYIVQMPVNLAFDPNKGIERIGSPIVDDSGVPAGGRRVISERYFVSYPIEEIRKGGLKVEISFSDINDKLYVAEAEIGPHGVSAS
jgi:hypothetical protein